VSVFHSFFSFYVHDNEFTNEVIEPELKEQNYLQLGEKEGEEQTWVDYIQNFFSIVKFDYSYNFQMLKPFKIDRLEQSPADSYTFIDDLAPNYSLIHDNYALNQFYDHQVESEFTSGKTSEAKLFPVNANGNPLDLREKFFTLGVGNGLYYSNKNIFQSIQVCQGRYLKYEKSTPAVDGITLARDIAQYAFDNTMEKFNIQALEAELNSLFIEFVRTSRSKNDAKRFMTQLNTNPNVVNFHLKSIFKAKTTLLEKSAVKKVGQGISAWSQLASNYFSLAGKIMNYAYYRSLKRHAVYDNRMTPEQLIDKTNGLNKEISPLADNVVTDYTEYDKKQNWFTIEIEKTIWKLLGFSDYIIELYYTFRQGYILVSKFMTGRAGSAKTSGERLTLVNNSLLNHCFTLYLVRGEGAFYIVIKGDDGWLRQLNLRVRKDLLQEIQKYVKMDIKISFEEGIEFCGCVVTRQGLVPNLQRKLFKLIGHRFRDYKHFTEYQISLRDNIRIFNCLGISHVVSCNMKYLNCSREKVMNILYTIQSFAHIDEKQFYKIFNYREVAYGYPTNRGMNI
jgi:hypothetical protein